MTLLAQCAPAGCDPAPAPVCRRCPRRAGERRPGRRRELAGSNATVDLLVNEGAGWQCVAAGHAGRVGVNGVRPLAERRSGDGTTPAGIFGLGMMIDPQRRPFFFFGNGTNPGLGGWHQVQYGDCWEETPGDPAYNTLVSRPPGPVRRPRRRVPAEQPRRLLPGRPDRRQHGTRPLRRPARRAGPRGRHLPAPLLVRERRQRRRPSRPPAACRCRPPTSRPSSCASGPARPTSSSADPPRPRRRAASREPDPERRMPTVR